MITTPDQINELAPGWVFVFGSNAKGIHGRGAALHARREFGAVLGVGEGLTGNTCYAFPTLDGNLRKRTMDELRESADKFRKCADDHPELTFLVTKVGTGLAGYTELEMAPLFADMPDNVVLPEGWKL